MILFGVRSPLVIEYEETFSRAGIEVVFAVSVEGTPRLSMVDRVVAIIDLKVHVDTPPFVACAFAPSARKKLTRLAQNLGLRLAPALIDPTAIVARTARIDRGSYLNAGAIIGGLSIIGECVLINRSASVGHHCIVGDYASIGPGVTLASNIRVGSGAVIGAGAVISPNVCIGEAAIVAVGAVVRKDVPSNAVVTGNPSRILPRAAGRLAKSWGSDE